MPASTGAVRVRASATASASATATARRGCGQRMRLGMSRVAAPSGAGKRGALSQGTRRTGRGASVEVRAAGVEGYWSVVCGAWADAFGVLRTAANNGVSRLGGLVIECNKKRGKGCTKEGGTKRARARTSGFRVRLRSSKGKLTIKNRRAKGRRNVAPASIGRKNK